MVKASKLTQNVRPIVYLTAGVAVVIVVLILIPWYFDSASAVVYEDWGKLLEKTIEGHGQEVLSSGQGFGTHSERGGPGGYEVDVFTEYTVVAKMDATLIGKVAVDYSKKVSARLKELGADGAVGHGTRHKGTTCHGSYRIGSRKGYLNVVAIASTDGEVVFFLLLVEY